MTKSQMMLLKIRRHFGKQHFMLYEAADLFDGVEFSAEWFHTQVKNGYIRKLKNGAFSNTKKEPR